MDGLKRMLSGSLSGSLSSDSDGGDRRQAAQIRRQEVDLVEPITYERARTACSMVGLDFAAILDDLSVIQESLTDDPPSVQDMQRFLEYVLTDDSIRYEYEAEDGQTETRKLRLDCMPAGAADAFFLQLLTDFLMGYASDFAKAKVVFSQSSIDPGSIPESWTIPMSRSN
mgnify:FL=1